MPGARRPGRPRSRFSGAPHTRRPRFRDWTPSHVILRLRPGLPSLRGCSMFRRLHRALMAGAYRAGFRLVHYSVQSTHVHLVVDARDAISLTRAVQGLSVRVARAVNRQLGRRGKVFRERFRSRPIQSPVEARNVIRYVLNNARRHAPFLPRTRTAWRDPCSSAPWFDGFSVPPGTARAPPSGRDALLSALGCASRAPKSWLLERGWREGGAIDLTHVPGPV